MTFHILDVISVITIALFAAFWLIMSLIKSGNKCITICSGCSGSDKCSTKNFSTIATQSKPIRFYS